MCKSRMQKKPRARSRGADLFLPLLLVAVIVAVVVVTLLIDAIAQIVEPTVEVRAFPEREAIKAIARLQPLNVAILGTQIKRFTARQRPIAQALVDPVFNPVLPFV